MKSQEFMKLVFLISPLLFFAGCGDGQSTPKETESVNFNGIKFPGRAVDAKAAGFTDCKADYYGYACQMARAFEVLGITPAKTSLVLNGRAVFASDRGKARDATGDVRLLPTEVLAYDEIQLDLVSPVYDEKCVVKTRRDKPSSFWHPLNCLKAGNSIDNLRVSLEKSGWREVVSRRYRTYMHPQEGVSITLQDNRVSIRRVDPTERSSTLAELAAREAQAKARDVAGQKFIEGMAK